MNILKRSFIKLIPEIGRITIRVSPILEMLDYGRFIKVKINNKMKAKLKERLEKNYNKILTKVFNIEFDEIDYNKSTNILTLSFIPDIKHYKFVSNLIFTFKKEYFLHDIIKIYEDYIKDSITAGPDTWMNDNILIIKKTELDNNYYFNLSFKKFTVSKNKIIQK